MRKIINALKAIVPVSVWLFFRKIWYSIYDLVRGLGPYVRIRKYCGLTLYYNRGNNIIRRLKKEPIFEREMCEAIEKELSKSDDPIFVDIGANIGLISSYAIWKVKNLKKIYAFEPGRVQREMLTMTVDKNGLKEKMMISPKALSKEVGTMTFYSHDPKYVAGDGFIDTGRARGQVPIEVEVDTLDSWWLSAGKPRVSVVKMDTEGSELWVLLGGRKFLAECKPAIFLEIEPQNLRVYPHTYIDILRFMEDNSYALFDLSGQRMDSDNMAGSISKGEDTYLARFVGKA